MPSRPVPVQMLVHRVWGDAPPAQPRAILATYVSRLRRALRQVGGGAAALPHRSGGYVLHCDPTQVDLHAGRILVERARALASAGSDARA
ncbi:MAG TPA: helix-turn-helix domain-containing protein, partial [Actinoplanes sp.]|nr:helix-turn-helix domain-containing protein [Actinoplanes sp.]